MIDKLDAKKAVRWLRLDSDEQRERIKKELTVPNSIMVDAEMWRRRNEAMETVLTFVEEA